MEGKGGTDQKQGSNVTANGKTPGTSRQREGHRLSPGKPWRKQHKSKNKLQTSEKHQPPKQQKNTKKDKHKNLKMFHVEQ